MDDQDEVNSMLRAYEKALRKLKDSDRLSDEAPQTFGALAAKIRAVIDRRLKKDRREVARDEGDRTER
jgi:hypothetical protein